MAKQAKKGGLSDVSTHSRPKAAEIAADLSFLHVAASHHTAARTRLGAQPTSQGRSEHSFNTQPPEGG